jgi:enamine deaminase RidA (YjgF/YER057c/UK114 family)
MKDREKRGSGAPWEAQVGYSRTVRVGSRVWVAGTTSVGEDGEVLAPGDAYGQAVVVFEKIGRALAEYGGGLEHVVRTRMFATQITDWEDIARAHGEFFADIRPVSTLVQVAGLIDPEMLIEIEVDAVLDGE